MPPTRKIVSQSQITNLVFLSGIPSPHRQRTAMERRSRINPTHAFLLLLHAHLCHATAAAARPPINSPAMRFHTTSSISLLRGRPFDAPTSLPKPTRGRPASHRRIPPPADGSGASDSTAGASEREPAERTAAEVYAWRCVCPHLPARILRVRVRLSVALVSVRPLPLCLSDAHDPDT
jgi:hypothetical protein